MRGPRRVLHVYRTYFPDTQGGLEETIRQICLNTHEHGFEHRVFTLSARRDPPVVLRPEAEVHRCRLDLEVASCGMSLEALRAFRGHRAWADILHYHFPWPFGDLLHMSGGARRPALVSYQSDIVRQRGLMAVYRPLMDRFLRSMDAVVATSPNYAGSSPVLGACGDRLRIIPNGLSADTLPAADPEVTKAVEARVGRGFFLFVGVLRYYKGLQHLLAALEGTDLRAVIAGSGPEERALQALAREKGIGGAVFLGRVGDAEKAALLELCRAVVFPSHLRSEAYGVTLVEGAMHGKALVCAEIGTGTTFINRHGETGLVVPPGDPDALRAAMRRLADDPAEAERLGRGARQRYESLLTGAEMGRSYARLYEELLERSRPA